MNPEEKMQFLESIGFPDDSQGLEKFTNEVISYSLF